MDDMNFGGAGFGGSHSHINVEDIFRMFGGGASSIFKFMLFLF
jgi:hypothetical protein